jgi:hypothetical protein
MATRPGPWSLVELGEILVVGIELAALTASYLSQDPGLLETSDRGRGRAEDDEAGCKTGG